MKSQHHPHFTPPASAGGSLTHLKAVLQLGLLSTAIGLNYGCASSQKVPSLRDYLRNNAVDTRTELRQPEKSGLKKTAWQFENTKDVGVSLEALIKKLNPEIVAFGEIPTPFWVSSHSNAYRFVRDCLPAMRRTGFADLVVAYINVDASDDEIAQSVDKEGVFSQANVDLQRFKTSDLVKGCRASKIRLHKGGFLPDYDSGRSLSLENYQTYGLRSHLSTENNYFVDILGEIKVNSERSMIKLHKEGKKVMWYGPHDFISLDEKALHASAAFFEKDKELYAAVHDASSFAKEFREEGFGAKYMSVYVIVPDFIPHAGLLARRDFRMWWDKKVPDVVQIGWQKVEGCYNVVIIYPFEDARSGASMKDKIMRNSSDEEILLAPEKPKEPNENK